ncbi:DNA polymerase delta subunit 4 isoform X1 [Pleurodeles waltl]|uniref:DNA polymerase delta subunit 4 isoform X1 n=1 Tax=Pleurodeles waltl TaxID=8319 RepID=UPI00370999DA
MLLPLDHGENTPPPPSSDSKPAASAMSRRNLVTDAYKAVKRPETSRKREKREEHVQETESVQTLPQSRPVASTPNEELALERLRSFDLEWRYGPCTGITRLERWERAEFLGLQPPKAIRDLVLEHRDDPRFVNSLWSDYPL